MFPLFPVLRNDHYTTNVGTGHPWAVHILYNALEFLAALLDRFVFGNPLDHRVGADEGRGSQCYIILGGGKTVTKL